MNELKVLNEQVILGKEFKVYGTVDELLFKAKDVAEWIEHSDTSKMVKTIDPDEKLKRTIFLSGQNREVLFLTEDGLYEVLMQSRMSIARQFKKEVKKILKSIRKDGGYIIDKVNDTPEEILARAILVAQSTLQRRDARIKQLEIQEKVNKPYVDFANKVADTADAIDIGTFAKLVKDEGVNIGRNKLFSFLRDNKYLDNKNVPYQKYINNGYFKIIEQVFKTVYGNKVNIKTLLLGIGQIKIMNRLKEEFGNE